MNRSSRALSLVGSVAVLCAIAPGCSKPVAPLAPDAGRASGSAIGAKASQAPVPSPYIVRLKFVGPVVTLNSAHQPVLDRNSEFFVYSTGSPPPFDFVPDTVPAHSELKQVLWRTAASAEVAALSGNDGGVFEAEPVFVGAEAKSGAQAFLPGMHVITLQAPERAGGGRIVVAFHVNFSPGTWWAGPDPASFPRSSDGDGRAVDVSNWSQFTTAPAWPPDGRGYFGPDSFRAVPSQRRPVAGDFDRRTFYEIFGDRIYARSEGDTVHQDAWVVLVNGGFDRDSWYVPIVNPADPALPAGYASNPDLYSVLIPQGLLGSPSAFRSGMTVRLPDGTLVRPSQTVAYPNFDPFSVFRSPHVAGYRRMSWPGTVYANMQAFDADGGASPRVFDEIGIVDRVDAGGGTPYERMLRRQILTFHVRPPATSPAADGEAGTSGVGRGERAKQ